MIVFDELNDDNFLLYAANNYTNPRCIDADEFYNDLDRFKYTKRLINKYVNNDVLSERLILNHLTIIFNVFGIQPGLRMLEYKLGLYNWHVIKPFLILLRIITNDQYLEIEMDKFVVERLREI
jgi:hypothetical protein